MESLDFNGKNVSIWRKPFYRGMSLTIEPNGELQLKVGQGARPQRLLNFLASKKKWIDKHLAKIEETQKKFPKKSFKEGELYPFCGNTYALKFVESQRVFVVFSGEELLFHCPKDYPMGRAWDRLREAYKETAAILLGRKTDEFSKIMKLKHNGVSFRAQKSIWGSCSGENKISLNWKLIVAPSWVIDYVVIHELAHIRFKDHSSNFWKLVELYTAKRKEARIWLRENVYAGDFLTGSSALWPAERLPEPSPKS